jgi:hypothetical protein
VVVPKEQPFDVKLSASTNAVARSNNKMEGIYLQLGASAQSKDFQKYFIVLEMTSMKTENI